MRSAEDHFGHNNFGDLLQARGHGNVMAACGREPAPHHSSKLVLEFTMPRRCHAHDRDQPFPPALIGDAVGASPLRRSSSLNQ
jgi:hypothetical protein